jgi:hypothetical protein
MERVEIKVYEFHSTDGEQTTGEIGLCQRCAAFQQDVRYGQLMSEYGHDPEFDYCVMCGRDHGEIDEDELEIDYRELRREVNWGRAFAA